MKNITRKIANLASRIAILKSGLKIAVIIYLKLECLKRNTKITFSNEKVIIKRSNREIVLNKNHYFYALDVIKYFEYYFEAVEPQENHFIKTVDYSKTSQHKLAKSGVSFEFPSLPESDESTNVYLNELKLQPGEVVLDLGAYAGASAYFMSKAVGDNGLVISLEPDINNFKSLRNNIARHNLKNIIPISKGIWSKSTTLQFQAEGNMGSSASEIISRSSNLVNIEVLSLDDASLFAKNRTINAIKIDIEGAELELLKNAQRFLKKNNYPRLVIEPHLVNGKMNTEEICNILQCYGYTTKLLYQGVQNWPLIGAKY